MKVLSIRNTTFFTGTKTDPVNRRYKPRKLDTLKSVRSTWGNERDLDVTSLTAPFLGSAAIMLNARRKRSEQQDCDLYTTTFFLRHRPLRNKRSTSQVDWPTRALLQNGSFCYVWGLISLVDGVRFRSGKKCCVSNAKNFHQAQYLKSPILPFNMV